MSDMWHEASADHDLEAREAALAQAEAEMLPVWPFLFEARSGRELEHRLAFAEQRLEHIAARCGLEPGELEDTARRRYALLKEALPEGVDPVTPMLQSGRSFGSGPEEGYEHEEGPDFAHSYAEIPQGPLGGPNPAVTGVPEPAVQQQPVAETTAAKRCSCGAKLTKNGNCKACKEPPGECSCKKAKTADSGDYLAETPPDIGTGRGSVDLDVKEESPSVKAGRRVTAQGPADMGGPAISGPSPGIGGGGLGGGGGAMDPSSVMGPALSGSADLPAGMTGGQLSPDGMSGGSLPTQAPRPPQAAGSGGTPAQGSYDMTPAQDVTASRRRRPDPVRRQVEAVAASVQATNPYLSANECRRVARRVVGTYLRRQADMASSVMSDEPWANSPGDGGGDGGHGGMSGLEEYGLGKSLINKLPGGGAGAGELAEGAELAAL